MLNDILQYESQPDIRASPSEWVNYAPSPLAQPVVMITDDDPGNLKVLMDLLKYQGFKVLVAVDGESAIEQAVYAQPDLILLDIMMPGLDGFETCRRLKANKLTHEIPVIFMTALTDTLDKVKGFELGAVDYITKPLQLEEVLARVEKHLMLHQQQLEIQRLRDQERLYYEKLVTMKDALIAMASHDLNNPLSIIQQTLQLMQCSHRLEDEQDQKHVAMIDRNIQRMRQLIKDLLDMARDEARLELKSRKVDLNDFLRECFDEWPAIAEQKTISFVFCPDPDNPSVKIDPDRVRQAVDNLISNAIKYTPQGGTVTVTAGSHKGGGLISIDDTGYGIPPDSLTYIFDPFYRVGCDEHMGEEGTGLGLAIAKKIVSTHNGDIQVESKLGEGTTFTILLP